MSQKVNIIYEAKKFFVLFFKLIDDHLVMLRTIGLTNMHIRSIFSSHVMSLVSSAWHQ